MITRYTIAILPFRDLSPKSENEYLCDGITEEIQNALAYAGLSKAYTFIGITGQLSPQEVYLNSKRNAE